MASTNRFPGSRGPLQILQLFFILFVRWSRALPAPNSDSYPPSTTTSSSSATSSTPAELRDTTSNPVYNYYFVIVAVVAAFACILIIYFQQRKKRQANFTRQQVVETFGRNNGIARSSGNNGGVAAEDCRLQRQQPQEHISTEGLDERGEAPPPYAPAIKPPSTTDADGVISPQQVTETAVLPVYDESVFHTPGNDHGDLGLARPDAFLATELNISPENTGGMPQPSNQQRTISPVT
ncbi:BgTH12-06652 [Blumeria graminis f. sp. triticale]|uniref:BgtAcSP-30320 n=3 Tax=Blumeria graminis TaxID=34373 RepID=A0A9X9PSB7_BLUGR|nr:hypothetical protein BGT96224_AcSP30320 [Blumeria graminis f. sp. tritici 96224]CAD6500951.1 BgTH12-06652 [Blumeria graminis f. sp. triticale]VCU41254.1 BgtAcSP-30320 [Blumeria graminis f. sp. tritici]